MGVDLAGSERTKKTNATGERLQEGIAINQSLSALSRVIQALANDGKGGIGPPFRESKLTLLLKDALSGNSRTVLLACISPAAFNLDESVSTLEFASRCKLIKTNAKKNEQDKKELIESLTAEKEAIASQLEIESQQRQLLQQELEKEVERSKGNQELAERLEQEKIRAQSELKELEKESIQSKQAMVDKVAQEELQKVDQEQRLRKLQGENDLAKQEQEEKAKELQRLKDERE